MTDLSDYLHLIDEGRFRALLFDCDGTLADTSDLHHFALAAAVRKLGHEMPKEWYLDRIGLSLDQLLDDFRELCGRLLTRAEISPLEERLYQENIGMILEIRPVVEIVRKYAGKIPMAVVSSSSRPMVLATLEELQIASFFSAVVTVEQAARPKPAPDAYLEAARLLHVEPSTCLVLEDSDEGLKAARQARMAAWDVRRLRRA